MEKLIMIKYGELTTKDGNRKMFINLLRNNIKNAISNDIKIVSDRVRMYISTNETEEVAKKLKKIFGIHGIVICTKIETNEDLIIETLLKLVNELDLSTYKTFKIFTKRADKKFPISSMEFNNKLGDLILDKTDLKVDIHHPDLKMHVEIRPEGTFIYFNEIRGIGGYPVGVQGKGILMLSGGIDSPVAGYMALKRGITLECLYFESPPHTSIMAKNKVKKLASIINEYSGNTKLLVVPFTKIQEEIYKNVPENYVITIMRRMMYRIAEKVVHIRKAKVIINGESVGQVASQTLDSMTVINNVTNMPIIRPVACLDKLEIMHIANKIGTYETSILPYEDCCTIFLPKFPVINPKLEKCIEYEKNINYEELIDIAVQNIEIITNLEEDKSDLL